MRTLMRLRRRMDDDEGVTLVIVVLTLVALFGMLVLVVDVGGLLLRRRAMVNASDAAALAAAKSCVVADSFSAESAADTWAASNSDGVIVGPQNITQISGCLSTTQASGYVSVLYSVDQQLFFAPVLGFGQQNAVTTNATAVWGPPGAANPIPIVVYANAFNDCKLDLDPTPGGNCYIWEDNNNTQGSQSGFGFLDLRTDDPARYGWDSVKGAGCSNTPADPWIENYPDPNVGDLGVNYPGTTYVCRLSGNQQTAWASLADLVDDDDSVDQNDDEDILFFPINRCYLNPSGNEADGQVAPPNQNSAPVACGDTPHQYDIIGFIALKLKAIYTPNEARPTFATCSGDLVFPDSAPVNLNLFGFSESCFSSPPTVIDNASVSLGLVGGGPDQGERGPDLAGAQSGCIAGPGQPLDSFDYCYNPDTRMLYWNPAGPAPGDESYTLEFDWSMGGPCGVPPAGNNAGHCLVIEVVEKQIGGSRPGEGNPDSNLRAYKLCDETINGSCDPIQVP